MAKKAGQLDRRALFAALDEHRQGLNLTWREVAEQTGVPASTLTRVNQGKSLSDANLAALIWWASLDLRDFIMPNGSGVEYV